MTTITEYDLIFSFTMFFLLGVMLTIIVQNVQEMFARRRKAQEDKIDKIAQELHELRLEATERKF